MRHSLGIYIHIPFCVQKCKYCDFCSFSSFMEHDIDRYVNELRRRIVAYTRDACGYIVDTVYFGGGTPSTLSLNNVKKILNALKNTFLIDTDAEITFECNPGTVDHEYFCGLRELGINRLSMGLQSASDHELKLLGRIHTCDDFYNSFTDARRAGFDNISVDIMYGIPDQTPESLERTLNFVTSLSAEHISAYGLMIEEGTYFERHISELALADDDVQYEMYRLCTDHLAAHGYLKYEISNFAKGGKLSRHNMRYWLGKEYIGFGVAAHSFFGGRRFGNSRDISAFLSGEDIVEEDCILDERDRLNEYIMLRMRLTEGIDTAEYERSFGRSFFAEHGRIEEWVSNGYMTVREGRVAFTDKGFFVSNTILSEMLCIQT